MWSFMSAWDEVRRQRRIRWSWMKQVKLSNRTQVIEQHVSNSDLHTNIWRPPPSSYTKRTSRPLVRSIQYVLFTPPDTLGDYYKQPTSHLSATIKGHGRRPLHGQRGGPGWRGGDGCEWNEVEPAVAPRRRLTAQLSFLILCLTSPVQSLC